ncbi:hypothetical protein Afil01_61380 [Actinorhabdospora filicis]|uniref:Uncharacterized protein n=1 Tax=Actinorhabdospora filicis TaxID=1785913 RepID=A0A9W6SS03_9ACTN|nr:hypothetical protein [Actinorhabdospora filicis]GLZ81331.1 hypothetical protein Afil01_61380 [Actinorhabdospora filicis]
MSITISAQDATTIRTAAYGAVTLLSFAAGSASPHRVATNGSLSLYSATGATGHVLAKKTRDLKFDHRNSAALADQVLPALTASVALLKAQDPAEAENFRATVLTAVEAATRGSKKGVTPPLAAMTGKITAALSAE